MNIQSTYIRDKAQYLFDEVAVDGDPLDLHVIELVLEEVYQAGIDDAEEFRRKKNAQVVVPSDEGE